MKRVAKLSADVAVIMERARCVAVIEERAEELRQEAVSMSDLNAVYVLREVCQRIKGTHQ